MRLPLSSSFLLYFSEKANEREILNGKENDFTGKLKAAHTQAHTKFRIHWHIHNNQLLNGCGGGCLFITFVFNAVRFIVIIIVGVVIALFFVASVCCLIIFRCEYHCGAGVVVDTFHPWFVLLLSIWFLRGVVFLKPCILEGLSLCFVPVRIQYLDETDERMCYCLLNVPFDISVFWIVIVGFWLRISGFRWEILRHIIECVIVKQRETLFGYEKSVKNCYCYYYLPWINVKFLLSSGRNGTNESKNVQWTIICWLLFGVPVAQELQSTCYTHRFARFFSCHFWYQSMIWSHQNGIFFELNIVHSGDNV